MTGRVKLQDVTPFIAITRAGFASPYSRPHFLPPEHGSYPNDNATKSWLGLSVIGDRTMIAHSDAQRDRTQ